MRTPYAGYDVLAKWDTASFNDQTRDVLRARLDHVPSRRFLSPEEWTLLEAVVARLIPQAEGDVFVPIVPWIDEALFLGQGEGYRGEGVPPLREVWRKGLSGIENECRRRFGAFFAEVEPNRQDELLRGIKDGDVQRAWSGLDPRHFFLHVLLKTVAGLYYTHPAAWSEIGFGGPASPRGYVRLGFNERDPWEARERR